MSQRAVRRSFSRQGDLSPTFLDKFEDGIPHVVSFNLCLFDDIDVGIQPSAQLLLCLGF